MQGNRKGGGGFVFEGEFVSSRPWTNKETGEACTFVEVAWWGGSTSLRMASPEQAKLLTPGAWVRFSAPIKTFKENAYAGPATLTHLNDKAVA